MSWTQPRYSGQIYKSSADASCGRVPVTGMSSHSIRRALKKPYLWFIKLVIANCDLTSRIGAMYHPARVVRPHVSLRVKSNN